MFTKAKNNLFKNNIFTINTNLNNYNTAPAGQALNILYNSTAPNAILNAGGRADEVRCFPGTREEVIGLINKWRLDIENNVKDNQLFWLSGPAGAGKTAIVQSVAEDWKSLGMHTANFFFFRADSSRSHAKSFVSTLLYQIFHFCPAAREAVDKVLTVKPRILDAGLEEQVDELICATFRSIRPPFPEKILLLIDGLDECDSEAKTSQKQILHILDKLVGQKDLPFLVLVASRAEPHISAAFGQLTSRALSVFLDDQYSPEQDIHLFVSAEFGKIKTSHPHAALLPTQWPSDSDIASIVRKSSGQFIYAATVMRFLSQSSAVPSLSLEKVQGIVPCARNSPFVHLDAFYNYILRQADDHKAIRDIFSAALLDERTTYPYARHSIEYHDLPDNVSLDSRSDDMHHELPPIADFLQLCDSRYTNGLVMSCISDISTIVQLYDGRLKFYHASLSDFLLNQSRSDRFHVNIEEFAVNILPSLWNCKLQASWPRESTLTPSHISGNRDPLLIWLTLSPAEHCGLALLKFVKRPTPLITDMLLNVYPSHSDKFNSYFMGLRARPTNILIQISRLYYAHDFKTYKQILKRWITWAVLICDSHDELRILEEYCKLSTNEWKHWLGQKGSSVPAEYSDSIPLVRKYFFIARMQRWIGRTA